MTHWYIYWQRLQAGWEPLCTQWSCLLRLFIGNFILPPAFASSAGWLSSSFLSDGQAFFCFTLTLTTLTELSL